MTETSEALRPEEILPELQAIQTVDQLIEAEKDPTDEDRRKRARNLRGTSQAVIASEQEQERLRARIAHLRRVMAAMQAHAAALFQQIQSEKQIKTRAVLQLFESGLMDNLDLSAHLKPSTAEIERALTLDGVAGCGAQIAILVNQLRMAEIEHDRYLGEDFAALAEFLTSETLRMAGAAAVFEGELRIDPTAGRSGAARRQAAHHLRQYQQNKADAEKRG
jgi:hypothetical protein